VLPILGTLLRVLRRRTHDDYSASGAALAPENDVNTECSNSRVCPAQLAGEGAGIFGQRLPSLEPSMLR